MKLSGFCEPHFFGVTLSHSGLVKYLGVILDSADLERAFGCYEEGSQPVVSLWPWLYLSIIRPSISPASLVWWPGSQTASDKKRLSRGQRIACLRITGAICTTPTDAKEALTDLPPLDLVIEGEAWSAAHCLWSVGCWSYLHPNQRHSILTRLQKSDPMFTIGVKVWGQLSILNPNIGLLCWLERSAPQDLGLLLYFKHLSGFRWVQGNGGDWVGVYGQSLAKRLSNPLGKHASLLGWGICNISLCLWNWNSG